jgi:hypothetical protein
MIFHDGMMLIISWAEQLDLSLAHLSNVLALSQATHVDFVLIVSTDRIVKILGIMGLLSNID